VFTLVTLLVRLVLLDTIALEVFLLLLVEREALFLLLELRTTLVLLRLLVVFTFLKLLLLRSTLPLRPLVCATRPVLGFINFLFPFT